MITPQLLEQYGAFPLKLENGQTLFDEGDQAVAYYQVASGKVKMVSFSEEGKEFVQGFFTEGQSFGEPPLFGNFPYPSGAIAVVESYVWKLAKGNFFNLLKNNFDVHLQFDEVLSRRLRYKAMILKEISSYEPGHRILTLIDYFKEKDKNRDSPYYVPYTRQQIADMTGLRVETVIRSIKELGENGELMLKNRKIYR